MINDKQFFMIFVDVDFINSCLINDKMTELVNPMDVFCGLRCTEVESGWAQFREVNVCGGVVHFSVRDFSLARSDCSRGPWGVMWCRSRFQVCCCVLRRLSCVDPHCRWIPWGCACRPWGILRFTNVL